MPYIGNQPYQGVIDSGNILNGSIDTVDLKDGSVTSAKLETLAGLTANTYGSANTIPQITVDSKGRITAISTNAVSIPSGSISVTGGDITMSGNTGTAITNATIADGAVTTAKLASGSVTSAKLDTNITISGTLTVGGSQLGSSGLSVNGTTGNDDSQIAIKKPNQSTFSLLAWDGSIFIGYNNYFSNGTWVHSAPTGVNVQSLLVIGGDGVYTYASSNSGSSWNLASGVKLWDLDGTWRAPLNSGAATINGNLTLTGELRGPSTLIIDPAAVGDDTGTVRVRGNLQVDGTTTTVNSTTLEVVDLNIVVGKNATTAAAANGAGITIGNYASNPTILYNSTNNTFAINRGVEVTGGINVSGINVSGSLSMVNTTNGIYGHYYSTVTNGNITFYNAYNNTDPRFIWYGGTGSNLTYHTNNLALYPGTDVGLNLGLSNFRWNNFYVSTVYSGHMYPSTDNSYDLGSFTARWRNIYTADMHFSNYGSQNSVDGTWGNWTLQEGEESIYMLNNRTGRRYKIVLEEV